ncbi:MAG: hypothetical protein M1822_000003 [Bathelium mastoideum]|nr:MAG: hypothetical protein M1822_000003 [Bathelium mastoideum]
MRTIESVHRILHIPSFKREYEALWLSNTQYDTAIRVQIKLVLAIGATTYDAQFSLRSSAIRWVYEAQTWLSEPELKSRLNLQTLQTQMLLFIARETAGVDASLTWISAGALLRMAVFMGLHRDPSCLPKRTAFVAEMRRRLWNTILEMTLQSSMTSGAPPLLSIDDFDTEPPRNFDDDQLVGEDLVPTEEDRYTSVSIAIALRKTFPLRLAIAKFLNDVGSRGTYEETLQLDAQLRASYKILRHTLQEFSGSTGASPSRFALRVVDFIMHRYLSSLHIPFFGSALHESTYAFSRKVVVENSLKMWCAVYPPSSITSAPSHENMTTSEQDDLMRLTICGSTFFRDDAKQASLLIALELRRHLQEEESLGPVLLRPDLFRVVCDAKTWCLQCIDAGETNIKGYLFVCIVAMQIEGLMKGVGKNEMSSLLLNAAEEALEKSLLTLEEKVGQGQNEEMADEPNSEFAHMASELVDDWDLMATDDLFNLGNLDITSWMLTNNADQGLSLS